MHAHILTFRVLDRLEQVDVHTSRCKKFRHMGSLCGTYALLQ